MCPVPPPSSTTSSSCDDDRTTCDRNKKKYSNFDEDTETTVWQLSAIAADWTLTINRMAANCRNISDEVFPGIHVGDCGAAKNKFYLQKIGITHVLNTAEGSRMGSVNTDQRFYNPCGIKYKGLKLLDVAQTNISIHFSECAEFIDEALSGGGNVLVNCLMGISRSSTCVLAYLMLRQNMTAVEALTEVRRHREVRPNDGFLQQLVDLDNKLRRERGQLQLRT